ncbi:hypothetical protein Pla100_10440 [Neorhodopirellula pilleata]|uniref:Uncharacterized protein n=1 Tax=Neorhodopirellula pilleata TaxID=2714738 RepID=A0A5C6AX67_9BACT|nr:hypothetical protein Pla100_10440 [Neorhodopirellula pilleata]
MDEGGAFARAQSALRDDFGFDERAKFIVGGFGRDRFVVPGKLPLREVVQIKLRIEEEKVPGLKSSQACESPHRARHREPTKPDKLILLQWVSPVGYRAPAADTGADFPFARPAKRVK